MVQQPELDVRGLDAMLEYIYIRSPDIFTYGNALNYYMGRKKDIQTKYSNVQDKYMDGKEDTTTKRWNYMEDVCLYVNGNAQDDCMEST